MDNDLALYEVQPEAGEKFYLVCQSGLAGDWTKQLAKAFGIKMSDPIPKFTMKRLQGRVLGRVKP